MIDADRIEAALQSMYTDSIPREDFGKVARLVTALLSPQIRTVEAPRTLDISQAIERVRRPRKILRRSKATVAKPVGGYHLDGNNKAARLLRVLQPGSIPVSEVEKQVGFSLAGHTLHRLAYALRKNGHDVTTANGTIHYNGKTKVG